MTRHRTVRFAMVDPPTHDRPGSAQVLIELARGRAEPVRIIAEARSDHLAPLVHIRANGGDVWQAGIVSAQFRWHAGVGVPDLALSWVDFRASDSPGYAEVSDALRLASDPIAQWAVCAFYDTLALPGPPRGTGLTVDRLVDEAIACREPDGTWPILPVVAEKLVMSERHVRRVASPAGGWDGIIRLAREIVSG